MYLSSMDASAKIKPTGDKRYQLLGNGVFALGIVGFPVIAAISQILHLQDNSLSISYRIFFIFLSSCLLFVTIYRRAFRVDGLIIVFFAIYSMRMYFDLSYSFLPNIVEDSQFYLATTLLPTICIAGGRDWFDERRALLTIVTVGTMGNILAVYAMRADPVALAVASPNVEIRASLASLNPISLGYNGVFTAAAAVMLLFAGRLNRWTIPLIGTVLISVYLIVSAASRGPIVALGLGMIFVGLANRRARPAYVVATVICMLAIAFSGFPDLLLERFQGVGTDAPSLERIHVQGLSIDAALAHPLLGYAYIEPITGYYPHNLLIEAGLAIGVVGVVLMLWMQLSLLWNGWVLGRQGEALIPFLAATAIANAWISGTIWGSALFFVLLWLVRDHRRRPSLPSVTI